MVVQLGPSGLVVDGEERVRLCASLFPFRIPRELWATRLAQVRATGYDLLDVYVPWNLHETAPGTWDFTGRRDVGAFLDLAHEAGLQVLARPGPYICSEWDGGGLPAWLGLDPELRVRQAEPRYLEQVRRWFEQVVPLLASRQHGEHATTGTGGAVVAVQLENELDFFDCDDRAGYVGALAAMVRGHGTTVPLVACAGQGDLPGATGDVEGVTPAANSYPDDASPDVEAEVRRYAHLLAERGQPLLITETNRKHATLRRLLVSGATVIAPYLQASGYDIGWTTSVGNWGDPASFMTHDYDFGGYLSPVGEERPEVVDARVLSAVARTLGAALARSTTGALDPADVVVRTSLATSSSPSQLVLGGGGTLLGLPNLGDTAGTALLRGPGLPGGDDGADGVVVELAPRTCVFVLRDLPLARWDLPGVLRLATADLVGAGADGLRLASGTASTLALEDGDGDVTSAVLDAPAPGAPVSLRVGAVDVVVLHPVDVDAPAERAAAGPAPEVALTGVRLLDLPARDGLVERHELAPASEAVGVFRGRTHCAADLGGEHEALLVDGASDVVEITLDGEVLPPVAGFGAAFELDVAGRQRLEAVVETWGHSNFDDARLPALRLASLRGPGRVWSVVGRDDASSLWLVGDDEQWASDPQPLRRLGGWSSTRLGAAVRYRRALPVDGEHHHALHLRGLVVPALVVVDGADGAEGADSAGTGRTRAVSVEDPWLRLAPGEGRDVVVVLPHLPGVEVRAELLRLESVRGWDVEPQSDAALLGLAARPVGVDGSVAVELPLEVEPGQERWLELDLGDGLGGGSGGRSLRLDGAQLRVTAFVGQESVGRVWLDDPAAPRLTGGDPGRLWVPAAWAAAAGGVVRLLVRGTAGPQRPRLERVRSTPTVQ